MSLKPEPIGPIPPETVRVAKAACPKYFPDKDAPLTQEGKAKVGRLKDLLVRLHLSPEIYLTSTIEVADKLNAIRVVKGKLILQPDPVSDKLVTALEEISKIYNSMEQELVKFLALSFDPSEPPDKNRAFLLALVGEEVVREMAKARGSCGKITFIYRRYLAPWFSGVLDPTESALMKGLFDSLGESDTQMMDAIDGVAEWLAQEGFCSALPCGYW